MIKNKLLALFSKSPALRTQFMLGAQFKFRIFYAAGCFSKVPKTFRARNSICKKTWPAYSVKLVFSYVVKGIKIKTTVKFRAPRRLRFEDTKRIMSPKMLPKNFGTFEKRATQTKKD